MTKQTGGPRRTATAACNRSTHFDQLVAASASQSVRERMHVLLDWLAAEIAAAPPQEKEVALAWVAEKCQQMNASRQNRRIPSDTE